MARWGMWLRCIGEAVAERGLRAVVERIPIVNVLYDVASDALGKIRRAYREEEMRDALAEVASAPANEVRQVADSVARDVASSEPVEVQQRIATYLSQVPAVVQQSLRRPEDPTGKTVPPRLSLSRGEDLIPFLPQRLSPFQPGDEPPSLGSWRLVELLGVGGFGEVWKAQHRSFPEMVSAVKFCLDEHARHQLLTHEGRVVRQVMREGSHPGIVKLEDANLEADPPWLRYEYIGGGDLVGLVPRVSGSGATALVQQLASIVGWFHRLTPPVVHRDLKPGNILVAWTGQKSFRLRISDFGLGGTIRTQEVDPVTRSVSALGLPTLLQRSHTPMYASPQQRRGDPPDVRDDVYALAVIWYQLLIGDVMLERPGGRGWKRHLLDSGLASAEMLDLLEDSWDDHPDQRPSDAQALAERIAALRGGTTPSPVEPTPRPAPPVEEPDPIPAGPPVNVTNAWDEQELAQKVHEIITTHLSAPADQVGFHDSLIGPYQLDDLDRVEINMELEAEFGVSIPEEATRKFDTVDEWFGLLRILVALK